MIEIDGEPWMVGKDVAVALGYTDLNHCITDHVDEDDRVNSKTQGQNDPEFGQRGTWLINESGMYALVFSSKLPDAKQFKHWVTSEVLPTIRRHGAYMTPETLENMIASPEFGIRLLTALKDERDKTAALESKIKADAPAVAFANDVGECPEDVTVEKFAKATFDRFGLGRNRMHAWLRENKFLTAKRIPFQKYMDAGWFRTFEELRNGHPIIVTTITGKGQRKLYEVLSAAFPSA